MMDPKVWVKTVPNKHTGTNFENSKVDPNIWINTIPKKKSFNPVKRYSFVIIFFIFGLALIPIIKNETRSLQKEINKLQTSINNIKFDLHQATLDHQFITSPENISRLAKIHLENTFDSYKISQIKKFGERNENEKFSKVFDGLPENKKKIKLLLAKKVEQKKTELIKLRELYSKPNELPGEIKLQVSKRIEEKKNEIEKLYTEPESIFTSKKMQKWAGIQIVKLFLGIPIVPGK